MWRAARGRRRARGEGAVHTRRPRGVPAVARLSPLAARILPPENKQKHIIILVKVYRESRFSLGMVTMNERRGTL